MINLNKAFDQLATKFQSFAWSMVIFVLMITAIGLAMLYSAGGMSWEPWASRQAVRFTISFSLLVIVAVIDISFWLRIAYIVYGVVLAMLIGVELFGHIGGGAQRWIDFYVVRFQPSELMKIALVMSIARYFHDLSYEEIGKLRCLFLPCLIMLVPILLVLRQPDLGTAIFLAALGATMAYLAGVRWWIFALSISATLAALPLVWQFILRPYQRQRILTFLNPESDPLGAGYHITQSKIAFGSGGIFGRGFGTGTQSHLNFLPEKQTDFIFTMLAEELGLVGSLFVMALYTVLLVYGLIIGSISSSSFGRLLALGLAFNLFLYVFTNIGMVTGLLPVVGVPLPLISYGGTALIAVMIGFGLTVNVAIHRKQRLTMLSDGYRFLPQYKRAELDP